MSLCINPLCPNPQNTDNHLFCFGCGSELLLEGRYRVTHQLGGGGFGKTFEVNDRDSSPKVLKVLINNHPKAIELFQREAQVLSRLNHPGIPKVEPDAYFTFSTRNNTDSLHCLVMEKIEGLDLQEYLQQRGSPIDQKLAIQWLTQLVTILREVHNQNFFHRDIKPPNIMLKTDGHLALIDFGTARAVTGTYVTKQAAGQVTGVISAGYTPPEQMHGQAVQQSDFFALGRTFVYLLTSKDPSEFYDPTTDELRWRDAAPSISPLLADFLDGMMARLPSQRPQNAEVILQQLAEINSTLYPPPIRPQPPQAQTHPGVVPTQPISSSPATVPYTPSPQPSPVVQPTIPSPAVHSTPPGGLESNEAFSSTSPQPSGQQVGTKKGKAKWLVGGAVVAAIVGLVGVSITQRAFNSDPISLGTSQSFLKTTLTGHSNLVSSVAISPDGQTLASGSWDHTIKIWNLSTGKVKSTLTGHSNLVSSVAISPDGQTLASGGFDHTIKIWNLSTGKVKSTLTGHSDLVNSVAISSDGQTLASGSNDKTIKIWNLSTGKVKSTLTGHSDWANSVAISPDGQTLASGSNDKTIKIWNLSTGKVKSTLTGHSYLVSAVAFSSDGQTLASGSGDTTIKIWNLSTGKVKSTLTGHSHVVSAVAFSSDGQTLASGSNDKTIKIWNLSTGELVRTLTGHSGLVHSVAFSPDGQTLASGSGEYVDEKNNLIGDNSIKIWRVPQ
ncbi:MAG: protein kinase [Aphanothece sp. CMT-3BRIN-NPC111]|jgi:serine/threonine protein kinase|nr:protein kinase [Aphanothece sp. CMT-3BRIN-NPC111]